MPKEIPKDAFSENFLTRFLRAIRQSIADLWDAFVRFLKWIGETLFGGRGFRGFGGAGTGSWAYLVKGLWLLVYGTLLALLAIIVYRIYRQRKVAVVDAVAIPIAIAPNLDEDDVTADLPEDGWLNWRVTSWNAAIFGLGNALFAAPFSVLAHRDPIRIAKSKSNCEYSRGSRLGHAVPEAPPIFAKGVRVRNGNHEVTGRLREFNSNQERIRAIAKRYQAIRWRLRSSSSGLCTARRRCFSRAIRRGDPPYYRADPLGTGLFEARTVRRPRRAQRRFVGARGGKPDDHAIGPWNSAPWTNELDGELAAIRSWQTVGGHLMLPIHRVSGTQGRRRRMDERLQRRPAGDRRGAKMTKTGPSSRRNHRRTAAEIDDVKAKPRALEAKTRTTRRAAAGEYSLATKPQRWDDQGVDLFGSPTRSDDKHDKPGAAGGAAAGAIPYTSLYFELKSDQWRTIYSIFRRRPD